MIQDQGGSISIWSSKNNNCIDTTHLKNVWLNSCLQLSCGSGGGGWENSGPESGLKLCGVASPGHELVVSCYLFSTVEETHSCFSGNFSSLNHFLNQVFHSLERSYSSAYDLTVQWCIEY